MARDSTPCLCLGGPHLFTVLGPHSSDLERACVHSIQAGPRTAIAMSQLPTLMVSSGSAGFGHKSSKCLYILHRSVVISTTVLWSSSPINNIQLFNIMKPEAPIGGPFSYLRNVEYCHCQHSTRISKTMKSHHHHQSKKTSHLTTWNQVSTNKQALQLEGKLQQRMPFPERHKTPKLPLPSLVRCALPSGCLCHFQPWTSHCSEVGWPKP